MRRDDDNAPEGYAVDAVERWIAAHIDDLRPPFTWTRLEGGHSNLTYRLDDVNGNRAVIRRPPQGQLLPKAHDMSREWALISALGSTPVPVPQALGFCEDPEVTGAWFYVMGLIDGHALHNSDDTRRLVPEDQREKLAFSFIDALADLHAVDPDTVGLGDLGKREDYVGRQLKTWYRSWTSSIKAADYDDPRAHDLQRYLLDHVPQQGPARVVHGDYGLHNCLVGADCTIAAIVDWEISTLGDSLADVGYALIRWPDPSDDEPLPPEAATTPAGFPSRTVLAERYGERTNADLSGLDYYYAFNHWKVAAIVHGVYSRYREGKKSTDGVDLNAMRDRIDRSLTMSQQAIDRLSG